VRDCDSADHREEAEATRDSRKRERAAPVRGGGGDRDSPLVSSLVARRFKCKFYSAGVISVPGFFFFSFFFLLKQTRVCWFGSRIRPSFRTLSVTSISMRREITRGLALRLRRKDE